MAWQDPLDTDDDDEDYFTEVVDDSELTGKEPRFVKIDSMSLANVELEGQRVDELIATYIAARNQLATDRKGYKAREAKVKLHLQIISLMLMNKADQGQAGIDPLGSPPAQTAAAAVAAPVATAPTSPIAAPVGFAPPSLFRLNRRQPCRPD